MSQQIIREIEKTYKKHDLPEIKVGQTVEVDTIIKDGDKSRIQKFRGLVIAIKGKGLSKTFTVRKISNGIGVEKIFPFHSPGIGNIKILLEEKVRRSKLYFMRKRTGKSAMKIKKGKAKVYVESRLQEDPTNVETETSAFVQINNISRAN